MNSKVALVAAAAALGLGGCATVRVEPIEVKPIHITMDVNVKVDRAVEGLLGDIYGNSATVNVPR